MSKITKRVGVEGVRIFAYHGFYEEEQLSGTEFIVDLITEMPVETDGNDDLADTVNYEILLNIIQREMSETRKLIETVAWNILQATKREFGYLQRIKITLRKANLPVGIEVKNSVVEYEYSI